jgi:hypothetical protein
MAYSLSYEVTGISPQSRTRAQELKGFVASGTLYPPLHPSVRPQPHRRWSPRTIDSTSANPAGSQRDRSEHRDGTKFRYRRVHPETQCRSFRRRMLGMGSTGAGQRLRCLRRRSRLVYRHRQGACCTTAALCAVPARRGGLGGRLRGCGNGLG